MAKPKFPHRQEGMDAAGEFKISNAQFPRPIQHGTPKFDDFRYSILFQFESCTFFQIPNFPNKDPPVPGLATHQRSIW